MRRSWENRWSIVDKRLYRFQRFKRHLVLNCMFLNKGNKKICRMRTTCLADRKLDLLTAHLYTKRAFQIFLRCSITLSLGTTIVWGSIILGEFILKRSKYVLGFIEVQMWLRSIFNFKNKRIAIFIRITYTTEKFSTSSFYLFSDSQIKRNIWISQVECI